MVCIIDRQNGSKINYVIVRCTFLDNAALWNDGIDVLGEAKTK